MVRRTVDADSTQVPKLGLALVDSGLSVPNPVSQNLCGAREAAAAVRLNVMGGVAKVANAAGRQELVLSLIHYPWKNLGYEIVFLGPRPGYKAMTLSERRRIEVYVRPGDSPKSLAYDVAHELGHAFDLEFNNYERRRQWRKLRGIPSDTPWFGCNRCPDYETPAGDFAETFALLLLGPGNYHSLLAPQPTPEHAAQLAAFCQLDSREYSAFWRRSTPASEQEQTGLKLRPSQ